MKTTIDKAGRVVIPVALRERLGLVPNTELEVTVEDLSLRITRRVDGPSLERVGKRLVVRPTVPSGERPEIDVATLVDEERERWPV